MATQYITLKSSENNYLKYLWGSFSNEQVAIPVKSYNLGTSDESITFEIKNKAEIKKPTLFKFVNSLIKLRSFIIMWFPFYFVGISHMSDPTFNWISFLFAAVAATFLFSGLNIRNDVNDHISGYDRVNIDTVKKPIHRGWISAQKASTVSIILFVVAGLISLPSFIYNPELLVILLIAALLFLLGRLIKNNSYKNQHFGEFILFVLVGPALSTGVQLSSATAFNFEYTWFGIVWGLGVVYLIQINNFTHIMTSAQHGIRNTMTKLGFDLSQKFLILWWCIFLVFWFFYQALYRHNVTGWVGSAVLVVFSILFFKNLLNIKSPMGSGLKKIKTKAHGLFLIVVITLFLQGLEHLEVFTN